MAKNSNTWSIYNWPDMPRSRWRGPGWWKELFAFLLPELISRLKGSDNPAATKHALKPLLLPAEIRIRGAKKKKSIKKKPKNRLPPALLGMLGGTWEQGGAGGEGGPSMGQERAPAHRKRAAEAAQGLAWGLALDVIEKWVWNLHQRWPWEQLGAWLSGSYSEIDLQMVPWGGHCGQTQKWLEAVPSLSVDHSRPGSWAWCEEQFQNQHWSWPRSGTSTPWGRNA